MFFSLWRLNYCKNLRKIVIAFLKATLSTSMWFLRWTRPKWEKGPKSNSCEFTIKSNEPGKESILLEYFDPLRFIFGFCQKQIIVMKVVDQFVFGSIGRSLNMEVIVNEMEIAIRSRFLFLFHAKYELFHILGWFMWPSDCSMAMWQ